MKVSKKIQIVLVGLIALGAVFVTPTYAIGQQATSSQKQNIDENATTAQGYLNNFKNSKTVEDRMFWLRKFGLLAIDIRLESLGDLRTRVVTTERLSDENKNEILGNIDSAVSGLGDLRDQIEQATDFQTLKGLVQKIFWDYRIYAVEIPKDAGLRGSGIIQYVIDNRINGSDGIVNKIQAIIDELKNQGKDTTILEGLFTTYKDTITQSSSNVVSAQTEFRAMMPARDLTEPRAHREQAVQYLNQAKNEMRSAQDTLADIIQEIKNLRDGI